ncbi:MAG TPA: DUF3108 domain-containing protein [Candidatus Dormibacteraeota bacterium]|nr:DUF3108 domain-containing protein [Candidatus Dormibacteraeota bacterium]
MRPRRSSPATSRKPERRPHGRLVALAAALVLATAAAAAASALPAHPRRLEYRVAWNGIPAADASVAITPGERAGQASLDVETRARTNAFVDLFWSFRGTAKTTMLAADLTPVEFTYQRTMAGTPYLTWVHFDRADNRAHSIYLRGSKRKQLDVDAHDVVDPITAVFRARLSGAGPGDVRRYDIFTGEASYRVQLTVVAPEEVDVPAGHFRALRVVPEVWKITTTAQPDERLHGATIWVADDPLRTLLRIRSEVFVGAVTLDLVKVDA